MICFHPFFQTWLPHRGSGKFTYCLISSQPVVPPHQLWSPVISGLLPLIHQVPVAGSQSTFLIMQPFALQLLTSVSRLYWGHHTNLLFAICCFHHLCLHITESRTLTLPKVPLHAFRLTLLELGGVLRWVHINCQCRSWYQNASITLSFCGHKNKQVISWIRISLRWMFAQSPSMWLNPKKVKHSARETIIILLFWIFIFIFLSLVSNSWDLSSYHLIWQNIFLISFGLLIFRISLPYTVSFVPLWWCPIINWRTWMNHWIEILYCSFTLPKSECVQRERGDSSLSGIL